MGSGGNPVENEPHRNKTGGGGIVGGFFPIFEVCIRETGYEGGGSKRDAWWRQEVEDTKLRETLEKISQEARRR